MFVASYMETFFCCMNKSKASLATKFIDSKWLVENLLMGFHANLIVLIKITNNQNIDIILLYDPSNTLFFFQTFGFIYILPENKVMEQD